MNTSTELLKDVLKVLNAVPNFKIQAVTLNKYKNTYALATAIDQHLKHEQEKSISSDVQRNDQDNSGS
jgi:hypothetical protein